MQTNRDWRIESGGATARSVLECGPDASGPVWSAAVSSSASRSRAVATMLWLAFDTAPLREIWRHIVIAVLLFIALASARAQNFSIDWFTIDGGGGTSTGAYSVSGTIGQPDAGEMSGGNYSLAGGFWGADQTPSLGSNVIIKVWLVDGQVHLRFTGIPGRTYYVERAHSVTGPWPDRLAAITMPLDGVVEFVDTTGFISPNSFYRTSTD